MAEKKTLKTKKAPKMVKNWSLNNDQVLIVAGGRGYKLAQQHSIYRCQNERSFRSSRYLAFYDEGKIEEVFEILEPPIDNCTPDNNEILKKTEKDYPIEGMARVFKLKSLGKVNSIENNSLSKNGKSVPFTYGQPRYTTIDLLRKAKKTSELINGVNLDIITDTFKSDKKTISPKVDIIWVIDNSGSMSSYQNKLAINFEKFINNFLNRSEIEIPDFKMAVVTTDEKDKGSFYLGNIFTKQQAISEKNSLVSRFKSTVNVGTNGSATERGLKCSYLSVLNNSSFFRSDAMLLINIVSDEEDDDITDVSYYLNYIKSKKIEQRVVINAIAKSNFSRYKQAVDQTKGKMVDINSDFSNIMNEISGQIIELTLNYPLNQMPKNAMDIVVRVNGIINKDFLYLSEINAIKFKTRIEDNASIEVDYEIMEE